VCVGRVWSWPLFHELAFLPPWREIESEGGRCVCVMVGGLRARVSETESERKSERARKSVRTRVRANERESEREKGTEIPQGVCV